LAPEQSGYCGAAKLSQGMANMDSGTVRIHLHVRARAASDSTPPQDNQTIEKDSEAASSMPEKDPRPPNRSSYSPRFSLNLGNKNHVGSVPGFGFVVSVDAPRFLLVSSHRAECKRVCSLSGNIVIPPCASRAPPTIQCLGQDGGSSNKLLRLSPDVGGPAVLLDARAPPRAWARCTQDPHFDSSLGYTPIPPTPQQDPATRTLEGVSQAFVRPAQCP
jgi:hypothetical protein